MAIRNIVKVGDSVLEKSARKVEVFDKRLHEMLDDMADTLLEANGAGLAAPQVGILRRICLVHATDEGVLELINPEITSKSGEQFGAEGCLSLPGEFGLVKRPMLVTVKAQDRFGNWFEKTGEGLCARAFCHEIDHLNGVLFTAHVTRMLTKEEIEQGNYFQEEPEETS